MLLLCLGLWIGTVGTLGSDTRPPQIVRDRPRVIQLKTGSINRFVLDCVAVAKPPPTYTWYKDGVELSDMEGVRKVEDSEHTQLDFFSPQEHQAGSYQCEAANSVGRARSAQSRVVLTLSSPIPGTSPPRFIRAPQIEEQTLGSRVELVCEAEGSPEPEIVWLKNGEEVARGQTKLVIQSLSQQDVANYACNASNVAGYEYKNVIVNILTVTAKIKEGPKELLIASKGNDVVLPCRAEGYPIPSIQWSKDGVVVEEGNRYRVDSGFLKILKAKVSDQGNYSCTASNHGSDTVTGRLVVQDKTEIISGPMDRVEPVQMEVLEMECEVVADLSDGQKLTVIWKKDGQDLGSPGFPLDGRVEQAANHSLFLYNLTFSDSGTYTCVGGTGVGDPDTMSGFLTVAGLAPLLELEEVETERWEGERVIVDCRLDQGLTDKGRPKIYWYKDGERVGREGDRTLARIEENGERLVIDQAEMQHSGLWVCKAENSEGKDTKELQLVVRRKTELAREPQDLELIDGERASFQCVAVADPSLQRQLSVIWQKDGEDITVDCAYQCQDGLTCLQPEELCNGVSDCPLHEGGPGGEDEDMCDFGSGDGEEALDEELSPCDMKAGSRFVLADNTLVLCSPTEDDIGSYSCLVSSPMEKAIASKSAQLYMHRVFPWWIVILIIVILIVLMCLCGFIFCWRKRKGDKGYYNPMDPENLKHNKSDIYYTTDDTDSIMQETDTSGVDDMDNTAYKAPIFTPKTLRHLSENSGGSLGSLLEDDEFLNRGMNEDGSFRERYFA